MGSAIFVSLLVATSMFSDRLTRSGHHLQWQRALGSRDWTRGACPRGLGNHGSDPLGHLTRAGRVTCNGSVLSDHVIGQGEHARGAWVTTDLIPFGVHAF